MHPHNLYPIMKTIIRHEQHTSTKNPRKPKEQDKATKRHHLCMCRIYNFIKFFEVQIQPLSRLNQQNNCSSIITRSIKIMKTWRDLELQEKNVEIRSCKVKGNKLNPKISGQSNEGPLTCPSNHINLYVPYVF